MSDDRLLSALTRIGREELSTASDRAIRGRLETAWTARARTVPMPHFSVRRFAPVLAALVLVAGSAGTALGASADSPLWDARVALEEAGAFLRLSNDDRVAYLLDLVQSRTEEAARQEAAGHPGAAAKARAASAAAVVELDGNIPQIDTTVLLPTPSPSMTPTPAPALTTPSSAPSVSPSPSPSVTSRPASSPPTTTRTSVPTATPVRTETYRPVTPTPTHTATPTISTGTRQYVTIAGTVRNPDGTNANNACVSTSPTPPPVTSTSCSFLTKNGSYGISTTSLTPGQTITLYAYLTNPTTGETFGGYSTTSITAPTTVMPTITLTLRK